MHTILSISESCIPSELKASDALHFLTAISRDPKDGGSVNREYLWQNGILFADRQTTHWLVCFTDSAEVCLTPCKHPRVTPREHTDKFKAYGLLCHGDPFI